MGPLPWRGRDESAPEVPAWQQDSETGEAELHSPLQGLMGWGSRYLLPTHSQEEHDDVADADVDAQASAALVGSGLVDEEGGLHSRATGSNDAHATGSALSMEEGAQANNEEGAQTKCKADLLDTALGSPSAPPTLAVPGMGGTPTPSPPSSPEPKGTLSAKGAGSASLAAPGLVVRPGDSPVSDTALGSTSAASSSHLPATGSPVPRIPRGIWERLDGSPGTPASHQSPGPAVQLAPAGTTSRRSSSPEAPTVYQSPESGSRRQLPPAGAALQRTPDSVSSSDELSTQTDIIKGTSSASTISSPIPSDASICLEPCPKANGGLKMRMPAWVHFHMMRILCFLTVAAGLGYLGWKTYTVGKYISSAGAVSIIFLVCELLVFFASLMLMLELQIPQKDRPAQTVPESGPFPEVSVFVCCCKEPLDIIQDTVRGALHQIYPPSRYTVWVLDDGGDDDLRAWVEVEAAEVYGSERVKYLRRNKPKGKPHHYKAGNINHGLMHATGEFIALLDADMIPSRYFLTSLLPHFTAPEIAFVQCPQSFYNVVKGDPLNDSSQDFYDVLLPRRDGIGTAQCVGTGFIMRASALKKNGGFTVGSITEDFDTALSLHAMGYDTVYVEQRLQAGLAPWTLEGYIKQHQRWCTGSLQILLHHNPLFIRGNRFSLFQRLLYWFAGAQYYMNIVVLTLVVLPILIVAFDFRIMPSDAPPEVSRLYIIYLVPYVLFSRLLCYGLFSRLPDALRVQTRGEQAWYWMSFYYCMAILKFLFPFLSRKFEATGASKARGLFLFRLVHVWFHLLYCAAGIGVVAWKWVGIDIHDCSMLLRLSSWTPFIALLVQMMSVPVFYVLMEPWHPKPSQRQKMICYDEQSIPYFTADQVVPKGDWRILLFSIVPIVWVVVIIFYFYAAISGYNPPFCTESTFFQYSVI